MICSFMLHGKAFSVNKYYYKSRAVKTKEARVWEEQMLAQLANRQEVLEMAEEWRKNGGEFQVGMIFYYPESVFFNSHSVISAKTFDLSNVEKPLLDLVFNHTMQIDDRHVTRLDSRKMVGAWESIQITLELKPYQNT